MVNIPSTEKKAVVVFDHSIFSLQSWGGISRYFCKLAEGLYASGVIEPRIVAPLHMSALLKSSDLPVEGKYLPPFARTNRIRQRINNRRSSRIIRRIDPELIHATYYLGRYQIPEKTPYIITVFDMIHEHFPELMPPGEEQIPIRKQECVMRADHIICISQATKIDLMDLLHVPEHKISVIPLGCSLDWRQQGDTPSLVNHPYLLYVGNREGPKNFSRFLQIYNTSRLPHAGIGIVCFGGPPFSRKEKQQINLMGALKQYIHHLSGDDTMLVNLYRHAVALIYPSLYEGFGLPIVEAMYCGCPVICSNISAMPEVAGNAALYFDPTSCDSMQEVLETFITTAGLARKLREKGRQRARLFTWERCVRQTLAVYQRWLP